MSPGPGSRPRRGRAALGRSRVDVGSAQPDPERAGEGGLAAPRIRAGVPRTVPAHGPPRVTRATATAGAQAAASSPVSRAGAQFTTSSARAAAQPNLAYSGDRYPTMASSVFTAR